MRLWNTRAALVALAIVTASCAELPTAPVQESVVGVAPTPRFVVAPPAVPEIRISEFHYDDDGADAGEQIEISGPSGTVITGWTLRFYNGSGGAVYDTRTFSGTIPATCGARGVVVVPALGLQNGAPDGIALVDGSGALVEFISYEGAFVGSGGAAGGVMSRNIGVSETGTAPDGGSLSRDKAGTWSSVAAHTFGTCNDNTDPPVASTVASVTELPASAALVPGASQQFTATARNSSNIVIPGAMIGWASSDPSVATVNVNGLVGAVVPGTAEIIATATNGVADTSMVTVNAAPPPSGLSNVRLTEIHYDNDGADINETIEIEGPANGNLAGWKVVLYNQTGGAVYDTQVLNVVIPATCGDRGVVTVTYPSNGIQNGPADGIALVNSGGQVVEFLSYEGTLTATSGPATGLLSTDIGVSESSTGSANRSLQRNGAGAWYGPYASTFGACNPADTPPPSIFFSGRTPGDVPLPVGFQDQLFASLQDAMGNTIVTTFTWTTETPAVSSIDADGVVTALSAGSAILRATAATGTTGTWTLPTQIATLSATAIYEGNAEFGEPADNNASDDFIIRRDTYTSSFSNTRGTPNWVSYNLEATHFGAEDRCDCFTFDPSASGIATSYTTAAYTGAGAFHGYGIDRGHLARSFDRTSGSLDNAYTYYFSNIIPQAADQNQGPWAVMENYLGDLARFQNKEVYVIAGVAGSKGTLKDLGNIVIPAQTWKVAVIMPRDQGLSDIDSYDDVEVIAVIMPNNPGIRNVDWRTYETTVDAVEALSGYDLLALLADPIEIAVESGTAPPAAVLDGPYTSAEAGSVSMNAAGSTDPDGDALTYDWDFGDGATGTGVSQSHVYTQDGAYTVRLIVTDTRGLADTVTTMANVSNVAPVIGAFAGATLFPGETYTASGSFTDPGADTWSATVNYGAGAGTQALTLSSKSFTLSNTYSASGTFTVTVGVSDDDVTATASQTVIVLTAVDGLQQALAMVNGLKTGGKINGGNANALSSKLEAAIASLQRGQPGAAENQLQALLSSLDAMVSSGRLSETDAAPLRALVNRIIASI